MKTYSTVISLSKQIIVVAAVIYFIDEILIVQRSLDPSDLQSGLWEFPGGKVEFGEQLEIALKREIKEELNMEIYNLRLYDAVSDVFHKNLHAIMIVYTSEVKSKKITLNIGNDYRWVGIEEFHQYDFAKLDIPIVHKLMDYNADI